MDLENSIYGYLHEGGEIVPKEDKQIQYKGGQQKGMYIGQRMSYAEFVSKACERLDINSNGYTFHYTLEFDPSALQQLDDDEDMHMMLSHSYDYARIYVLKRTRRVEVEGGIVNVQNDYCHNSTEETHNSVASCQANNESNLRLSQGFMSRCAETEVMPHDLNVECSSQPSMRGRRGARIIEQVIRATPEYLPRQICKDFRSRYGVSLSYKQAWTYKEMAKERIYGFPENSYMLLPWLCQRLVDINPGTIAEYSNKMGILAIGSLFSATAYDADDACSQLHLVWLDDDYVVAMEKLKTYNSDLAKWVEENSPQHWAMSKFAKKRWDKMTTNLAESFNAWLKEERHYTIFNLVMTHMDKFAHLACAHMGSTENWKAAVGPKTEEKLLENIIKSGSLPVYPYVGGVFKVFNMKVYVDVNLRERTCTCKAWQMAGIPCEHACAAIRQMKQDVYEYVDSYFKLPMQQLIYSGHFNSIPNHNMPIVDADGCVRDAQGRLYPSLKPPCSKRPLEGLDTVE
ncbi:hypothetical protein CK203_000024 [Vitis vinifera]|uniref:SWIM-type domain-containing protein n=1 Tax=Vitis vinifera TaxID=29760 RepID=A0A438KRD3_VITVI|nr:hypothetical protein CK203_000024 [Vitis vinifera]